MSFPLKKKILSLSWNYSCSLVGYKCFYLWNFHWKHRICFFSQIKLKDHDTLQEVIIKVNKELVGSEDNPDASIELPVIKPDLPPLQGKRDC